MLEKGIFARKLIHFFTGIATFSLTYFTDKNTLLWIILGGSLFAFITYPVKKFHFLHKTTYSNIFYVLFLILASINFEVISFRGSDNLSIPLGMALIFNSGNIFTSNNFIYLTGVIVVMAVGSYLLYKWSFLTRSGSLNAYLLGVYLFGILGYFWAVPVILFFMSSVFFTKLNARANKKPSIISQPRNSWQVLANSMAAVVFSAIYLFSQDSFFILLFIASVAAVTADTWASEIGPVFNRKCLSLASFKTGKAGTSGGISVAGSVVAFLGAFSIAVLSYYLFFSDLNFRIILIITLSGFFASFVDSVLGAFLEPVLIKKNYFSKGFSNSNEKPTANDLVNILGSLSASLFFILMW